MRRLPPWVIAVLAVVALGLAAFGVSILDDSVDLGESLPIRVLRSTRMETRVMNACEDEARHTVPTPSTLKVAVQYKPQRAMAIDRFASADDVWEYVFEVDAQNVFGAMLRFKLRCTYQDRHVLEVGPA